MSTIRDARFLQSPTGFATAELAIAAVRCWVQQAEARGWNRSALAATLNVGDQEVRAMLGERGFIAGLLEGSAERELRRTIREHAPLDTCVLVARHDRREVLRCFGLAEAESGVAQVVTLAGSIGGV